MAVSISPRMPVGLYNSTIISCDFGDNVTIDNVNYISHYITGKEVIIVNVHELACTDHSKFGNGIIKEGEQEKVERDRAGGHKHCCWQFVLGQQWFRGL